MKEVLSMKKYLYITKNALQIAIVYRGHILLTAIGNIIYICLIYFLWKAIYASSESSIHGMSFEQTFLYLAFASSIYVLFTSFIEWFMSQDVVSGNIVVRLLKPYDYEMMLLFQSLGFLIFNLVITTIPTFVVMIWFFRDIVPFGINIPFFIISVCIAYMLSYTIDFIIGTMSFYTESIWGISVAKQAIVFFLSGAMIPLKFFPQTFKTILECLPFQAIYNVPLSILTDGQLGVRDYVQFLGVQVFWLVVLWFVSRLFFNKAVKAVTVNGG